MNRTGIEYLDYTYNPITGCSPVSAGCRNCWARRMANRLRGRCGYPSDNPMRVTFHPERLDEPLRLKKPARIGVCFMGDLFHDHVEPDWIDAVFGVMVDSRRHTFFVLTKRPENIDSKLYDTTELASIRELGPGDFLSNVYIGTSIEDQASANRRIPELCRSAAPFPHWLSVEPLLGPVSLADACADWWETGSNIRWVVAGGESGPSARPDNPDWYRALRDECRDNGTPFFMKQMSGHAPIPDDLMIRETP